MQTLPKDDFSKKKDETSNIMVCTTARMNEMNVYVF